MHPNITAYMWWDNESDGDAMYPTKSKHLEPEDTAKSLARNPEAASLKGNWSDPQFLRNVRDLNAGNQAYAIRRFQRPRLDLSRRLQITIATATGSTRTAARWISTTRRNSKRPYN